MRAESCWSCQSCQEEMNVLTSVLPVCDQNPVTELCLEHLEEPVVYCPSFCPSLHLIFLIFFSLACWERSL